MPSRKDVLSQRPLMVNLGSGPTGPESWVNLDRSPTMILRHAPLVARAIRRTGLIGDDHLVPWQPHIVRQDLTKPLPFADGSVHAVYSSHFFEHIYYSDAHAIARECFRVLRRGGVLRLALPDGEAWARELVESGDDEAGEAGYRYLLRLGSHPLERPTGRRALTSKIGGHIHRWQPTRGLVRKMLIEAGFADSDISDRKFLEGDLPEIEKIETREESFFTEARR